MFFEDKNSKKLRYNLVQYLRNSNALQTPRVIEAFEKIPRHLFLQPYASIEQSYLDQPVLLKSPVSTASQPQVMAVMLEKLQLKQGQKVLELGTASGYNAALLAYLVDNPQLIYTVEYEKDLALTAKKFWRELGYQDINLHIGDGSKGWFEKIAFNRIIITAEVTEFNQSLLTQLDQKNGLLIAPFSFGGGVTLLISLVSTKSGEYQGQAFAYPVNFVPLKQEKAKKTILSSNKIWLTVGRKAQNYAPDSSELWGLFCQMLKELLASKEKINAEQCYQNWVAQGSPFVEDFRLIFNASGYLQKVQLIKE